MDFLKTVFGDTSLTFEDFCSKAKDAGISIADLKSGNYVDKDKFKRVEDEAKDHKKKYDELVNSSTGSDATLKQLQKDLEEANGKITSYTQKELKTTQIDKLVSEKKVSKDFADYVYFNVKNDKGEIDEEKAKGFLEKNAQYIVKDEPKPEEKPKPSPFVFSSGVELSNSKVTDDERQMAQVLGIKLKD